ncbi:DUF2244 domain-containing protein [Planctomycetes bacterium K23_9]|uniref:PH domain-containing protein n=1 Tax=Stieleria marina TaxID=1930275 RepID=A0A517NQP9_9BACT|nr:hypothetical protein K239x_13880 [Planctomycetes bacterium K23_9]
MPLPEEMTLHPSPKKWAFVFGVGILFCCGGVLLVIQQPGLMSWLVLAFFGLVAAVGLAMILSRRAHLTLHADRFEQSVLGRRFRYQWNEVSEFFVWKHQYNSLVCFDVAKDKSVLGRMNRGLSGASGSLSDTFGIDAEDLAELMNRFRDRSLMRSGDKPF